MKYLIGFIGALITGVLLTLSNDHVFKFTISQFLIGWFSCMVYNFSKDAYEKLMNN